MVSWHFTVAEVHASLETAAAILDLYRDHRLRFIAV